jgi:predicted signal transduction protein with EAL and GGDEF domain
MAVKSLRVTAIAAIVLAPHHTKSSSIQIFSDSGTPRVIRSRRWYKTTKRQTDVAARIGGEEFVLLLPETDEAAAETTAERLRKAIQVHTRALPGENLEVTVSIGVAGASLAMSGFEVLLKHADEALYEAKRTGRNRVVRAPRTMTDQYPVAAE